MVPITLVAVESADTYSLYLGLPPTMILDTAERGFPGLGDHEPFATALELRELNGVIVSVLLAFRHLRTWPALRV